MRVAELRLKNWMRYAGEHSVHLHPTVYGVVGRFEHDARRSNWSGKTALLEAVRFALYGAHRHDREDGWIAEGQPDGSVQLVLTSGHTITRARQRGKATRLQVEAPDGTKASGDPAQALVEQLVGLGLDDFDATCWFGQKQLSRFIMAAPSERMALVTAWLRLEPLRHAADAARDKATEYLRDLNAAEGALRSNDSALQALLAHVQLEPDVHIEPPAQLVLLVEQQASTVRTLEDRVAGATTAAAAAQAAQVRQRDHEDFLALVERGKEVAQQLKAAQERSYRDKTRDYMQQQAAEARANLQRANERLKEARSLADGRFDGRCPLMAQPCPAADTVRSTCANRSGQVDAAFDSYNQASRIDSEWRALVAEEEQIARQVEQLKAQRDALANLYRDSVARGHNQPPPAYDITLVDALAGLQQRLADARAQAQQLAEVARRVDRLWAERAELRKRCDDITTARNVAIVAMKVLRSAHRAIAESALAAIEADANALLRDAGIDLVVEVTWAREGQGLATHCDHCGAPFPASAKVKACGTCSAPRGPKQLERLDVRLSDRSGAAEDLAGAAIQLAASAWLRRQRSVSWAVAFLDEPYGALDAAHRGVFASHLLTMLRGRYEQAFVVAHHDDVLDALPGRVIVHADEYGSRPEVAA